MNRPAGFDAPPSISVPAAVTWHDPWLTPTEARAARNAPNRAIQRQAHALDATNAYRAKQRRRRLAKARATAYAKVAGGSVLVVAVVAWYAVWMAY